VGAMRQAYKNPGRIAFLVSIRSGVGMMGLGLFTVLVLPLMSGGADVSDHQGFTAQGFVRFPQEELAPDFTLSDLEGTPHRLHDLKGQVVLLVFWATW
jgi:cytochrome oxidase Cu insertion factor (SCO1/SenC/PrrC family)